MTNIMSDDFQLSTIRDRIRVNNSQDMISLSTLANLSVVAPSVVLFLIFNFGVMNQYGLLFLLVLVGFLLYLPFSIVSAGLFLRKKSTMAKLEKMNNRILPAILFFMLLFSIFGIYIPTVTKLAQLIPAFSSLNIIGGIVVFVNLLFMVKNLLKLSEE